MRDEIIALYCLLQGFVSNDNRDAEDAFALIDRICYGLSATLDAHLQRTEQLEARCIALAAEQRKMLHMLDKLSNKE
jgi:hypothetical protein